MELSKQKQIGGEELDEYEEANRGQDLDSTRRSHVAWVVEDTNGGHMRLQG